MGGTTFSAVSRIVTLSALAPEVPPRLKPVVRVAFVAGLKSYGQFRQVVSSVIEKFHDKYTARDVKKYYSKFDVAVVVNLAASVT
jgi:hypothetical protein